jgi:hypothetical protein
MRDKILEEVWKVKEDVSNEAPGDFRNLISSIKKEAKKMQGNEETITTRKNKFAESGSPGESNT